jgi:uncharacterized Zn-binding protein involved in type VI secretion
MPAAVRKDGVDATSDPDGSGFCCGSPSSHSTNAGSGNVFTNSIGNVRQGDAMITHTYAGPCCTPHAPTCSTHSPNVFINSKGAMRKGDAFGGDHITVTGSNNVFING